MRLVLKNITILILIILVILSIYFGIILTFKKSVYLISGLRQLQGGKIQTVADFKEVFSKVLDLKAYVGQEEAVKVVSQYVLGVINNKDIDVETTKELVDFIDPYFIEKEIFHNLIRGQIYYVYYLKSNDLNYFKKIEEIYLKMIEEAPNMPIGYNSLFDFYLQTNQKEKAKEIGLKILTLWPNYKEIQEKLSQIEEN